MEVRFCERCSVRVTEMEIAEGDAFSFGNLVFCRRCWASAPVQGMVARASGMRVAAAADAGAPGHSRVERRQTPRGHAAVRATPGRGTPVPGRRRTPVPLRPQSPLSLSAVGGRGGPAVPVLVLVLFALVGAAAGVVLVVAAMSPRAPVRTALAAEWLRDSAEGRADTVTFDGQFNLVRPSSALVATFPVEGRWTLSVDARVVFDGPIFAGGRVTIPARLPPARHGARAVLNRPRAAELAGLRPPSLEALVQR